MTTKMCSSYSWFTMVVIGLCHVTSLVQSKCSPICRCTSATAICYSTTLFRIPKDLPITVRTIRFHDNRMQRLTAGQLQRFPHLEELTIPHNNMVSIDHHALLGLDTLKTLNVSHNELTKLHNNLFKDLVGLETLDLSYNKIASIHSGAFENLKNLETLSLESNLFTHIPHNLLNLSTLEVLNLGMNSLKQLQPNLFTSLPSLTKLSLNWINLTYIPDELFTPMTKLRVIYLAHNQVTHLRMSMFVNLPNLRFLQINDNNLTCDCLLLEMLDWMNAETMIAWVGRNIPDCTHPTNGIIQLNTLSLSHFDNCTIKKFVRKTRIPKTSSKTVSMYKSKYTMPYDPRMGLYTAVTLTSMLVMFLLCVAYYKIKKRVKRRIRRWKVQREMNKIKKDKYVRTSTSDIRDTLRRYSGQRLETVSMGSDSIVENGSIGRGELGQQRRGTKGGVLVQETVV